MYLLKALDEFTLAGCRDTVFEGVLRCWRAYLDNVDGRLKILIKIYQTEKLLGINQKQWKT